MPKFRQPMTQVSPKRFVNLALYQKQLQTQPSGCIEWTGSRNNCGYGLVGYYDMEKNRGQMMTPHRLALMLKLGREIAPGMNANHWVCHNRLCCNPDHIEEGTQRDKMRAMAESDLVHTGRRPGQLIGSYNHRQANRKYRYTDDEITWYRNATIPEIMQLRGCEAAAATRIRGGFRHGFRWLPGGPYAKLRPGRKPRQ
jgi:hypothetical protein